MSPVNIPPHTVREAIGDCCDRFCSKRPDEATRRAIGVQVTEIVKSAGRRDVFVEAAFDWRDPTSLCLVWHGPEFDLSQREVNEILDMRLP